MHRNYNLQFLILTLPFLVFVSNGCKKTKSHEKLDIHQVDEAFASAIKRIDAREKIGSRKAYLVIPHTGCSGCINEAEKIFVSTIGISKHVGFVLTRIESVKILKSKFGIADFHVAGILLDKQNLFENPHLRSIYPRVYIIENNHVDRIIEVSPQEDGLGELRKVLLTEK